jgi:hypothetical protein
MDVVGIAAAPARPLGALILSAYGSGGGASAALAVRGGGISATIAVAVRVVRLCGGTAPTLVLSLYRLNRRVSGEAE